MGRTSSPRVVALCGSLREESRTRIALETALDAARGTGASTELVDLRSYDLPSLYATNADATDAERLRRVVDEADGVLLGTPNYHGSYSGALKDALDHCGREQFEGTFVGLLEAAGGARPGSALAHLRTVSRTLRAWTLPTEVAIPNSHATVTAEGVADPELADRIRRLGRELAAAAGTPRVPDADARRATAESAPEADD